MGFLFPLALFFGLSLPILLVFYLLKVRRKPRRVSSTLLWREAVEDARASVPFQKLRRNLLMLIQLLILALLTLALARPVYNMVMRETSSPLILIDVSASMAMRDASGRTRLEQAREKAARFIASMPRDSQALLLSYADRASAVVPYTTDRDKLHNALNDLETTVAEDNLHEALSLAASLIGSARNPRIVIFSDSARLTPALLDLVGSTPVVVETCGEPVSNYGWTALDLHRGSTTSRIYDLFGQLVWHGADPIEVAVEVEANGAVIEARRVELSPNVESPVVIENLELEGEPVLHVSAETDASVFDALALDNDVWARVRPSRKLRILFCTPGNYFLSRALGTIDGVEVAHVPPDAPPPSRDYDAAVYDRSLPSELPATPALYIGISPWDDDEEESRIAAGEITNWDTQHPVTRFVQWSTVTVHEAQRIAPPPGSRTLVESGDAPLLVLGRSGDQTALYLTFDLFASNFPLRGAFPIFVKNAVGWLTQNRAARDVESLRGGETFSMSVPENVGRVAIVSPEGKGWALTPGPDRRISFADTYRTGLWSVEFDGKTVERFGVNLLNANESDPAVAPSESADGSGSIEQAGLGAELRTNREIWHWFAAAALALLLLEWYLYQRRFAGS